MLPVPRLRVGLVWIGAQLEQFCLFVAVVFGFALIGRADDHVDGFDDSQPTWRVRVSEGAIDRVDQRRVTDGSYRGEAAEYFAFHVSGGPTTVVLDHKLPSARVIDDLKLRLMLRSNANGATIGLRVVFPKQNDPRTRTEQPLKILLHGDAYTKAPQWQALEATTTDRQLQEQIRLLRAKLRPMPIDVRDPIVDRVVVELTLDSGTTEVFLDELRLGPVIEPVALTKVQPIQFSEDSTPWPVTFQLDRLSIGGRPFFPRMLPYHNERIDSLRDAGLNVVWIPDVNDVSLQQALREQGLWATAMPPKATSSTGEALSGEAASLVSFSRDWDNILAWNLGVAMSGDVRRDVLPWLSQVQSADRDRHRPIMADVTGGERIYSRHVSMIGSSRHVLNSGLSFKAYRDSLDQRRKLARPGSFLFTWIPTEALPDIERQRQAAGRIPMIVEPEQLRLLVYSAIASGCRGLGYSLSESLESKSPGADERRLAIAQLNLEIELLEDFLAAGTLIEHRPFEISAPPGPVLGIHHVSFGNSAVSRADKDARSAASKSALRREARLRSELEAAVFRTDKAVLLLPIWYEHDAQFVPGQLAAPGATIDVASVADTASAWEITTTRVASIPSEPVPGGRRIKLPSFDQTAAIVVTSDPQLIVQLKRKVESIQATSARHWIDLAKAKLNRVRIADDELTKLGVGQPDAPQLLAKAHVLLRQAENIFPGEALDRAVAQVRKSGQKASSNTPDVVLLKRNFDEAARLSQASLQALRILQKAHWETATQRLASPVGSPHTLCFQTLPDHWRLLAKLGKSATRASDNLLPSGDFEVLDFPTLTRSGWQCLTNEPAGIRAAPQVLTASGRAGRCLRLVAAPETNTDPPSVVETPPITIVSPAVPVRAGQVLHVSGWVRVGSAIAGSVDGVTLRDNLTGMTGAWHWHERREWQRVEMLREAYQDGDFSLTIALHGLGDVQFDDLQIIAHNVPETASLASKLDPATDKPARQGRFEFLQHLPRFPQRTPK